MKNTIMPDIFLNRNSITLVSKYTNAAKMAVLYVVQMIATINSGEKNNGQRLPANNFRASNDTTRQ
ncbi:hypothetical protein, partial [Serratia ureilytica]|uniref:hypothetical protein n=1 Tax=Serratia ureilytica TaxID=300181 RepID=UPI00235F4063